MAHSIEIQRSALEQTKRAALAWWEELRPFGWSLRQHLDNPTVNTFSKAESKMAECVAAAVECGAI
jgi:hypothetical protein